MKSTYGEVHYTYRRIRPFVVQLPPTEEFLAGFFGKLPFLLFLGELLLKTTQVAAVLLQEMVLQLSVFRSRVYLRQFCLSSTVFLILFR